MSTETILSFLASIPLGIIGGLYAGIIVARYQRFADLRLQAKKIVLEIDFVWEDNKMIFPKRKEMPEFSIIASDLLFLGHTKAGHAVLRLCEDIQHAVFEVSYGRISSDSFSSQYQEWQHQIRSLSPSTWQILRFWGGL